MLGTVGGASRLCKNLGGLSVRLGYMALKVLKSSFWLSANFHTYLALAGRLVDVEPNRLAGCRSLLHLIVTWHQRS